MIFDEIKKNISSKPYQNMNPLGNCGVISSYVKEDIVEYIDDIDNAYMVQGTVRDKQGNKTPHYFVYIPPEEYGGNDYIIVDATINQFTEKNKQKTAFIKSSFGSLDEFRSRGHDSVLVCKRSESIYNHSCSRFN